MLSHAALVTAISGLTVLGYAALVVYVYRTREPAPQQQHESEPERGEVLLAA